MATRLLRPRIHPTWRGGLRRGKVRMQATRAFERCPAMKARLLQVIAEMDAMGRDRVPTDRFRQPFDYERR